MIFGYIAIFFALVAAYIFIRNQWVFEKRESWNALAYTATQKAIRQNDGEYHRKTNFWEVFASDVFESYNSMLFKFWIWDAHKFIVDEEKARLVLQKIDEGE
jgi:hypothetical protein